MDAEEVVVGRRLGQRLVAGAAFFGAGGPTSMNEE